MPRYFSVKCKHCSAILKTSIELSSKGAELDKLTQKHKIKCQHCGKTATYGQDDFLNQP
jgi:DNA-directed RNA polymerase subunit RPC12/RpoP